MDSENAEYLAHSVCWWLVLQLAAGEQTGSCWRWSFDPLVTVTRSHAGHYWTAGLSTEGVQHSHQSGYSLTSRDHITPRPLPVSDHWETSLCRHLLWEFAPGLRDSQKLTQYNQPSVDVLLCIISKQLKTQTAPGQLSCRFIKQESRNVVWPSLFLVFFMHRSTVCSLCI